MEHELAGIDGLLIDLDGTVYVGDRLLPGAADAIASLRRTGIPLRFGTNTTRMPRSALAEGMRTLGLTVEPDEIFTAPLAAAGLLEKWGLWNVSLYLPQATFEDFGHFTIEDQAPQAIVIGDLGSGWSFDILNRAFRQIRDGAEFLALQRNRYWETEDGLSLDAGAFVAALEFASGQEATLAGKPSPPFFQAAADSMGVDLQAMAVVGDDITTDVAGARACGAKGVLVRTGKFRDEDLEFSGPKPNLVLDSLASLPAALVAAHGGTGS